MDVKVNDTSLDIPVDASIQVKWTNPLCSEQGSMSPPISLQYNNHNLAAMGWPNRIDSRDRFKTSRSASIRAGIFFQKGKLKLFQCSKTEGMPSTFYFGGGALYSDMSDNLKMTDLAWPVRDPFTGTPEEKVVQWLDHLTQVYKKQVTADYDLFPVCVSFEENNDYNTGNQLVFLSFKGLNGLKWVSNSEARFVAYETKIETDDSTDITLPIGYGVTPFLKLSYILRKLFSLLGYTLLTNIFDTDPDLSLIVELNNTADAILKGTLQEVQLVPDKTVKEFLKAVCDKYNVQFVPDGVMKTVTVWGWNDMLDSLPDMDLTPLISSEHQLEYVDPEPLKLSDGKSITLASTAFDSYAEFAKKYSNPSGMFNPALQAYFKDHKRVSSNFFDIYPTGSATEDISAGDSAVPMVGLSLSGHSWDGIIYCPYIGSRRHLNSEILLDGTLKTEETVDLDIMFCFAVPGVQQTAWTQYPTNYQLQYWMGSPACYDAAGVKWGNLCLGYFGEFGTYNRFFTRRDVVKQTSYNSITVNLKLNGLLLNKLVSKLHTKKLYQNQPVILESLTIDLSDKLQQGEEAEVILRTIKQYGTVAQDSWAYRWTNFVCELISAGLPSNIITLSDDGQFLITATAQYPVTSDIDVFFNWETDFVDAHDPDKDTHTQGIGKHITILAGQTTGTLDVNTAADPLINNGERLIGTWGGNITLGTDGTYNYFFGVANSTSNDGFARSLTIAVDITYSTGYVATNEYDGKMAFSANGHTYAAITVADLKALSLADFTSRAADWVAYFNTNILPLFPGLIIDVAGARIYNTTLCPL